MRLIQIKKIKGNETPKSAPGRQVFKIKTE